MNEEQLFKLYEKLYFHEIDMRERLNSRLQIPLTIIAILLGFLAFMLQNKCSKVGNISEVVFWILFVFSIITISLSILFFILSWYSYKHKLLPSATSTDQYKRDLLEHFKDHEDPNKIVEKYLKEYLYDYYRDFSSENTIINDKKSFFLHLTNLFLIISVVLLFLTFIPYYFGPLDKSNFIKPIKVVIEQPVIIENRNEPEKRNGGQNEQKEKFSTTNSSTTP